MEESDRGSQAVRSFFSRLAFTYNLDPLFSQK